ncbi:MAG: hypothetical protein ACT4O2_13995 [Beijerinckiaceae bacterium]
MSSFGVRLAMAPAHEAARAVENGEFAAGTVMDAHLGQHEMGARRMLWDLQRRPFQATVLAGGGGALFLNAKDAAPLRGIDRHEGRAPSVAQRLVRL